MLNPDFKDMLSCLNGEAVKFIIVGAYALAVFTMDDIEINVLSKADLLQNKLAVNRDKDMSDIAWLTKN